MNFETVGGLEVHVELNTNSKSSHLLLPTFGNDQNANTNVIDWSFPGYFQFSTKVLSMPVSKAALASTGHPQKMHFDRKSYFYPDNPKAYQISQFDGPIGLQRLD